MLTHTCRPGAPRGVEARVEQFRLTPRSALLILAFSASLLLVNLGNAHVLSYHETIFAQPAKEMLATGQWVLPTIAGLPNTHKPPLTHWLIAASMALFDSRSELVARLPSLVSGTFTALLVAAFAARWLGRRARLVAGLMQATTFFLLRYARLAEADMPLTAAVCAAMTAFAFANVESPAGKRTDAWLSWLFYLAAGAGFMIKGPLALVFILGGCVSYLILTRDRDIFRFLLNPVGLTILAVRMLAWPAAVYRAYPEIVDDWFHHHIGRFRGDLRGFKPWPYYLYTMPAYLLPWTPFLALPIRRWWRSGRPWSPLLRFVACWIVPGLLLISFSAFKRKHYAMPLMPPLVVLISAGFLEYAYSRYRERLPRRRWLVFGIATLCGLTAIGGLLWKSPPAAPAIGALVAVVLAGLCWAIWLEQRRHFRGALFALFASTWLVIAGAQLAVLPHYDDYRPQAEFAHRANVLVPRGEPIYLLQLPEDQITYYLTPPVIRIDKRRTIPDRLKQASGEELYALGPARITDSLATLGEVEPLATCSLTELQPTPPERLTLVRLRRRPIEFAGR